MSSGGKLEYFMIAGAAVLWGTVGVFLRWVDLPGQEYFVVFMRAIISVCFLTVVIYAGNKKDQLRPGKHPFLLLVSGVLLTFHWVMFLKALNNLSIGDAEFITYLAPVLVAVLAPLLLKEKLEGTTVRKQMLMVARMNTTKYSWPGRSTHLRNTPTVPQSTAAPAIMKYSSFPFEPNPASSRPRRPKLY